jgi:Undecaprenyl-phosphate glucose phosphotransferase
LSFAIAAPALILSQRILLKRLLASVLDHGWIERRNILLVADFATEPAPHQSLRAYNVFRTYVFPEYPDGIPSMMDRITNILRDDHCISEVHLALNWASWSDAKQLVSELRALPVPVRLMADRNAQDILQYKQRRVCGAVSFELQRAPLSSHERAIKRLFDIAGSALGLLVLAPLFLVVSAAIRIDSPGPIVFRQKRGGFNGRAFHILKFRTMRVLEDGPVVTQAKRDDERVTRLGRWLRRSSLDELPQLINVLRGDMSLVGPRPHALAHDDQYRALISTYPFRHYVKPGITGWAQVKGFRGETPTINLMRGRVDLDLWYVGNWSFWLDLRILLRTAHEFCRSPNAF